MSPNLFQHVSTCASLSSQREVRMPSNKTPSYNLALQVTSGSLKLFSESIDKKKNIDIILKISGLWEDDSSYGITYKFLVTD